MKKNWLLKKGSGRIARSVCILIVMSHLIALYPLLAGADDGGQPENAFFYNIRALLFADVQHPAGSTLNPDNAFLNLYRYSGELHVRPDFFFEQPAFSAVFRPRFISAYRWWEDGAADGETDSQSRAFINEWRLQARVMPTLFLSFGKEKLLWGPAFLTSPSNILFKDIEKVNPTAEVEGKYLAKAVAVPNGTITVSVIAETRKDENEFQEKVNPLHVLKIDFMTSSCLLSLLGYHRSGDHPRLGSFGQWTASDALVLYYDGIVSKGADALYPVSDPANPLGGSFSKKFEDSDRLFTTVTAGGSYTFLTGATVNLEFLYNRPGYSDAEAGEFYQLRQNAHDLFFESAAPAGLAQKTLAQTLSNGLSFLRRYYLMGQFQVREIKDVLDVALRYVHGIEEHAGQASTIIEWRISNRVQLFNINTFAIDHGQETEFNSILDKSFMTGLEIHF